MTGGQNNQATRIIKTARTEETINQAARNGYFPLVKKVSPSPKICSKLCSSATRFSFSCITAVNLVSKFAVFQNPESGEISVSGDYRSRKGWDAVIGYTFYYPHNFPSPFAAYLIPSDIQIGEVVILQDLIEDIVGTRWNQGDVYRLNSCEAEWNGKDFIILHDESMISEFMG